jgi:hypothetical protein
MNLPFASGARLLPVQLSSLRRLRLNGVLYIALHLESSERRYLIFRRLCESISPPQIPLVSALPSKYH